MRILHATKRYPRSHGGDGVVVVNLQQHQEAAGHEVHILTSNCPEIVEGPRILKFGLPISSEDIDHINLRRIVTLGWLAVHAFWYLRKVKPDVIHSHTMDFGFALSLAARLYRIPTVHTSHGVSFDSPVLSPVKGRLELFLLKSANHRRILTVDANSPQLFAQHGIPDVVFTPNAVEPGNYRPHRADPGKPFRLICVARLEPVKGLAHLVDAVSLLVRDGVDVELVHVGDGGLMEDLRRRARDRGVDDVVRFVGRRTSHQVAEMYEDADAFVLPSLHEGFPLVLLEAWAAHLPAVVTGVGGIPGVCVDGEDCLVVRPGEPAELAAAIARLVDDAELRRRLGERGRERVETEFTYAATTQALESLYREVLL